MKEAYKKRVNLYIDEQLLEFGKRFSYVTGQSLSGLFEGFLRSEEEKTKILSAENYLQFDENQAEEWYVFSGQYATDDANSIDEYLRDQAEIEYCKKNPDSIRAKLRIQLIKEQQERDQLEMEKEKIARERREKSRQEFIKRWNETF